MITIEFVKLYVSQYLEMIIRTNDIIDLDDLLNIPAIGRKQHAVSSNR